MTWQGWMQILIYVAVLTALTPPLGGYMARVYMGQPSGARASARARGARVLPSGAHRPVARSGLEAVRADGAGLLGAVLAGPVRHPGAPGGAALQSAAVRRGAMGRHLQHDLVVHHQHELAVLRRRDDHVVPCL